MILIMCDSSTAYPIEISCHTVNTMLERGEDFLLLDCRTYDEISIARLEAAKTIPMDEIANRLEELTPHQNKRVVVFCHLGGRSLQVTEWLRNQGFLGAQNMTGGIDAWAREIDSKIPRY